MDGSAIDATTRSHHELMELSPGTTVSGRYRVHKRAWSSGRGDVWLAHDAVLERPVLIQTFPGADAEAIGRAVARTAQLSHPGLSQIYDVCSDPPAVVFEHAPGGRLADRKDGALSPADAARMVCQLSSAIGALHEHGISHGAISPETVLFDEEGRPKLAGALTAAELDEEGDSPAYRPPTDDGSQSRDTYALGAVAYRLFTGREPGPDAPPARSAKRGLPPSVDALLSRALARDAADRPTLAEFRRVLEPIAAAEPRERGPGFFRQEMRWLLPVLLVLGLGGAAIAIGVATDTINIGEEGGPPPTPTPSAAALSISSVDDFDPRPQGNGEEHSEQVVRVTDEKDTAWATFGYETANLGGLKDGVGLLFDLGSAQTVGRIEVRTPGPGWKAEWRAADDAASSADGFRLVKDFTASGDPVMLDSPTRGRFWLLWITQLVDSGAGGQNRFNAQVSEVRFFAR